MFNLESEIKAWRRHIQSFCRGDRGALDELEDHLREEISTLTRAGRSEQDAWSLALAKLGDPETLRSEFAKIDRLPAFDRFAFGAMLGIAAIMVAVFVILLIARGQRIVDQPVLTIHVATITLGYSTGIFAAALASYNALRTYFANTNIPALNSVTLRMVRIASIAAATLTLFGFAFGAIWALREWGKPFTMDPREIGALAIFASFIAASVATVRNALPARVSLTIAIAAGATVVIAGFGAAALHDSFPPLLTVLTIVSFVVLLGLAALCLKAHTDVATKLP
jgi:hypothetical protein